jgi:hypothetical protein
MSMTLVMAVERIVELERQMADVLKRIDAPVAKPVKETKAAKKSPKKEKPDGEPKKKRGMTGYLMFAREKRTEVKAELGDVKPTEVITEVAKRWKALTDDERMTWNTQAKEEDVVSDE